MLDVHPPHAPTHTWKDFLIHIATICVGLLIAVGLEQTVEAIHRHHERQELLAALHAESSRILQDTANVDRSMTAEILWLRREQVNLSEAARTHHPPVREARPAVEPWDTPGNPIYKAAAASAKLSLLTPEETAAYGELNSVLTDMDASYILLQNAWRENAVVQRELAYGRDAVATPEAQLPPGQMHMLYSNYASQERYRYDFRSWCRSAHGAAAALATGELDLGRIEESEKKFYLHD